MKLSLHLSGDWRNAWVKNQQTGQLSASGARFAATTGHRLLDQWRRPDATGAVTHGVSITVSHDDVQPWFNDLTTAGEVEWSDVPGEDCVGVVSVLLVKPYGGVLEMPIKGIVAVFGTESGEAVWVTARELMLEDDEIKTMRAMRSKLLTTVSDEEREALAPGEQPRGIYYSTPEAGQREIWDVALVRDLPG